MPPFPRASRLLHILLGLLLLGAAALKAHQLLHGPPTPVDAGILESRPVQILAVDLEILLGLALLSGLWPRVVRVAACLAFAVFSVVTLGKLLAGEASCGCFGSVPVKPAYTLAIDLTACLLLVLLRPASTPAAQHPRRGLLVGLALLALAAMVSVSAAVLLRQPATITEDGTILGEGLVLLRPASWVDKRLPLLPHLDIGDTLAEGPWMAILYREDCLHCREVLPAAARRLLSRKGARVAFIRLPPHESERPDWLPPAGGAIIHGALAASHDWFVTTPVFVQLRDGGIVHEVAIGSENRLRTLLAGLDPKSLPIRRCEEMILDLGYLPPGQVQRLMIDCPLPFGQARTIEAVQSDCGCMEAGGPGLAIVADRLRVPLVFETPTIATRYDKRLLLVADGAPQQTRALRVCATVGIALTASPAKLRVGPLPLGESCEVSLDLRNHLARPLRILFARAQDGSCTAAVPQAPIPAGGEARLRVTVTARREVSSQTMLIFSSDADEQATLQVPVEVLAP